MAGHMRQIDLNKTYFSIFRQVYLERFGVVFKAGRRHSEKDVLAVDCFPLLLLTLF